MYYLIRSVVSSIGIFIISLLFFPRYAYICWMCFKKEYNKDELDFLIDTIKYIQLNEYLVPRIQRRLILNIFIGLGFYFYYEFIAIPILIIICQFIIGLMLDMLQSKVVLDKIEKAYFYNYKKDSSKD